MAESLTARQLAERLALRVTFVCGVNTSPELATYVLQELRDSGYWFCRISDRPLGLNETNTQLPLEWE